MILANFSERMDPPLVKKIAMYNSGIPLIENYERDIDKLYDLNAESLRVDLSIGKKHCLGGNVVRGNANNYKYNFTKLAELAIMLNKRDVLPYYSWCYIPEPLQKGGDEKKINHDIKNWEEIYRNIHREYAAYFRRNNIKIGYHEVHNEPDLLGVFLSEPFEVYLRMYKAGSLGLKDGDKDAVIGGPALAIPEKNTNPVKFVDFVAKEKLPLDFFSFHVYWENDDFKHKLQCVRDALSKYSDYNTVPIHINEFNYVGGWQGKDSINNNYKILPHIFDLISQILAATDVTLISWAQFMESSFRDDSYGIIHADAHVKASFNAFKIYADLPVKRVSVVNAEEDIGIMAAYDDCRACTVIWNRTDKHKNITYKMKGVQFNKGNIRLYRLDENHGSFFDSSQENLSICENINFINPNDFEWHGIIPPSGVAYFVAEDSSCPVDFIQYRANNFIAKDIRTNYYFSDRNKDNYQFFDRKTWKVYLGMGNNTDALSMVGIVAEDVPDRLEFSFERSGIIEQCNSSLGLRIDYMVNGQYEKAVFLHDGLHSENCIKIPWGTDEKEVVDISIASLDKFIVNFTEYAPDSWNGGRVILTFFMKDTGRNTRVEISIK